MATLVTYDIPSKHIEFKKLMKALGYVDQIPDPTCKIIYLPNTTLYHLTKDAATTLKDAQGCCQNLAVKLERFAATQWGPNWHVLCGEPNKQ